MILFVKIPNTVKYQFSYKFLDLSQEKSSDFFDKFDQVLLLYGSYVI